MTNQPQLPQDVEEFIEERGFYTSAYSPLRISEHDLRAWMKGHVRAPVELSEKMRDAYWDVHNRNLEGFPGDPAEQAWEAMINASKDPS